MKLLEYIFNVFDRQQKEKTLNEIWPLLINTYKNLGGLNMTKEELLNADGIWKFAREDGKIVSGILYRNNYGLKIRLVFSNNTISAKRKLKKIIQEDMSLRNVWVECSGPLEKYLISINAPKVLASISKKLLPNITKIHEDNYHYEREISPGIIKTQIVLGNPKL